MIVLPAYNVKEVPLAEGQFLGVTLGGVVVKGFYDLYGNQRVSRGVEWERRSDSPFSGGEWQWQILG